MLAQHPTNTAHLQSRSQQPLLPNLQQFRPPILASQPSLLNQHHQFVGQPIAWPPNQSPLMVQNSLGQFVLNTPTLPQILLPNQQSKEQSPMQFVSDDSGPAKLSDSPPDEETGESSGSESEKINQLKAEKRVGKERQQTLKSRQMGGTKMLRKKKTKKLRITYKPGHKSTQQMNDELLMFEAAQRELRNGDSGSSKSLDGSRDSVRTIKRKLKSEKKKISIVKPRVVLTHKVNEFFIQESDHPFPVDGKQAFKIEDGVVDGVVAAKPKNADPVKTKDGKKLRKYRKLLKSSKLAGEANSVQSEPTSSNDLTSTEPASTSQLPLVELSDDDQGLGSLEPTCSTESGDLPAVDEPANQPAAVADISSSEVREEPDNETGLDPNIYQWSVEDVYRFVLETTSNEEFATALKLEQFDGQSLVLLTIPILRNNFNLKLGPILLLKKRIESYKDKSSMDERDYLPAGGENIFRWSVEDVSSFVWKLTSKPIADQFERQEMDGYSLTLISCDNIRNDLGIAFGPALKIISKINELKEKAAGQ